MSTLKRARQGLPAGHGVDFDRVQLAVAARQQVDAGHRRADRIGRPAGQAGQFGMSIPTARPWRRG